MKTDNVAYHVYCTFDTQVYADWSLSDKWREWPSSSFIYCGLVTLWCNNIQEIFRGSIDYDREFCLPNVFSFGLVWTVMDFPAEFTDCINWLKPDQTGLPSLVKTYLSKKITWFWKLEDIYSCCQNYLSIWMNPQKCAKFHQCKIKKILNFYLWKTKFHHT